MSLPISWVVAGAIPAAETLKRTANLAATSASHLFGALLQTAPSQSNPITLDSGRSAPIEPSQTKKADSNSNLSDRIDALRNVLSKFVNESRARFGLGTKTGESDGISIESNGKDAPSLRGPEPLRTSLENHLQDHPEILKEINEVASQKSSAAPLRLLPNSIQNESDKPTWTLWIE